MALNNTQKHEFQFHILKDSYEKVMLPFMSAVPKLKSGNILDNIMYGKYFEYIFSVLFKLYF